MKIVFSLLFVLLTTWGQGKTYDCFCFYNEFELLKLRLEELWDSVDYFVLVESIETQKGHLKPLLFEENKAMFEKYLSKIVHVKVEERHPEFTYWQREHYQRNCILRGLAQCKSRDIIMISDLDEIPRVQLIPQCIKALSQQHRPICGVGTQQDIYFFHLNRQTPTGETWGGGCWYGTVFTTYKELQKANPQYFRDHRSEFPCFAHAGWHFTWMGGYDKVRAKVVSVVEGDDARGEWSDEQIDAWVSQHPIVPIDASFPAYVIKNFEYLKSVGLIAEK